MRGLRVKEKYESHELYKPNEYLCLESNFKINSLLSRVNHYEDMIDHGSYIHNLSSCEIDAAAAQRHPKIYRVPPPPLQQQD